MAIASVTAWLATTSRPYLQGLLIYEQYGRDRVLLTLLKSGRSLFTERKLIAALTAINAEEVKPQPKTVSIPTLATFQSRLPDPELGLDDFKSLSDPIKDVRSKGYASFRRAQFLFSQIPNMDSEPNRLQAALTLLDDMDISTESWQIVDEFKSTGREQQLAVQVQEKTVGEMSMKEMIAAERNIPTYISKAKTKLAGELKAKDRTKTELRLKELEQKLAIVKEALNGKLV